MPIAQVNGIKLHYRFHGKGEPLVLIAGWGTDLKSWIFQLPAFRKHFRVVVSDKPRGPYSMKLMATDVIGLMDALQVGAAHVLGLSMGE